MINVSVNNYMIVVEFYLQFLFVVSIKFFTYHTGQEKKKNDQLK